MDWMAYKPTYNYLSNQFAKTKTDRITDLNNLLSLEGSFCLFSAGRNGTTTLLNEFTERKEGVYIDCHLLPEYSAPEEIETKLAASTRTLILDEAIVLFRKLRGYENAMDYVQGLSERMQVGLRLHPEAESHKQDMVQRGFDLVEIGKIPYAEFKQIVVNIISPIGFTMPERLIEYAHSTYPVLAKSLYFVAEAFQMIAKNPSREVTEQEVNRIIKERYQF